MLGFHFIQITLLIYFYSKPNLIYEKLVEDNTEPSSITCSVKFRTIKQNSFKITINYKL